MKRTYRNAISTAVTFAFAAALSLPAWAQEKPQEGAPAMQQKPAPKMEKKAPAKKAPAKAAAKKAGLPEVMAVQEALKKAGENPGPADGKMGRKTRAALRAFQKKNGLKTTGQADKATMAKLQSFMGK
jgi:peptidoglycan hydrolase-like protein with peptidoglycan-binding domain